MAIDELIDRITDDLKQGSGTTMAFVITLLTLAFGTATAMLVVSPRSSIVMLPANMAGGVVHFSKPAQWGRSDGSAAIPISTIKLVCRKFAGPRQSISGTDTHYIAADLPMADCTPPARLFLLVRREIAIWELVKGNFRFGDHAAPGRAGQILRSGRSE